MKIWLAHLLCILFIPAGLFFTVPIHFACDLMLLYGRQRT